MRWWILAALPLTACGSLHGNSGGQSASASGSGSTRSFAVSDFTRVDLRGSDDVDVAIGPNFAVMAEGDPKLLDELEIMKEGQTLRVGRKHHFNWSWSNHGSARVHVTMPRLEEANVAGSGTMKVARAQGDFSGAVAGSGDLDIAAVQGGKAHFAIAGSGNIVAAGTAEAIDVSIAGSGDVDSRQLKATRGAVSIMGSGSLRGTVAGPVDVSLAGSGDVEIGGGAKCNVSKMGSGEARCS